MILLVLMSALSVQAQKDQEAFQVEVLHRQTGTTASPETTLYAYEVRLTNLSQRALQLTNNHFVLKDSKGTVHPVTRFRYPDRAMVEPGKSITLDRIYFEIPKEARPEWLVVFRGRRVLGKAQL